MNSKVVCAIAGLLVFGLGRSAQAGTIGPSCGTCQGSLYTLTYNPTPIQTGTGWSLWAVTLIIDSRGFNGGGSSSANDFLDEVAIKVSSAIATGTGIPSPSLHSFSVLVPNNSTLGTSNWNTVYAGGLNANGCSGNGSGFVCDDYLQTQKKIPGVSVDGKYQWVFYVPVATGGLLTGTTQSTESTVKARYVNANGNKVGALVSEEITLTPSPLVPTPEPLSIIALLTVVAATFVGIGKARKK